MSQPITVYDTKTGEKVTLHSPTWVDEQVQAGVYSYDKPTPKRGRKVKSESDNPGAVA